MDRTSHYYASDCAGQHPIVSLLVTPLYTTLGLAIFCILSVSGVGSGSSYWSQVNPTIVPNMIGSALAGLLKGRAMAVSMLDSATMATDDFDGFDEAVEYAALLGFCGCCTTFGGMMAFAAVLWMGPSEEDGTVEASLEALFDAAFSVTVTIVLSCGSFRLLFPLGSLYHRSINPRLIIVLLCAPLLTGMLYLVAVQWQTGSIAIDDWGAPILTVCVAPAGAIPRALLALKYNKSAQDKLRMKFSGTLLANVIGSFIASAVAGHTALNHSSSELFLALSDGIAGSLSTVSTFVGEVEGEEEGGKNAGYLSATIATTGLVSLVGLTGFSS